MTTPIDKFEGKYRFLSNFWPAEVRLDGKIYPSVEHAYQAAKTDDQNYREKIRIAADAKIAKQLGKKAPMRWDWDEIKLGVMEDLLVEKFEAGSELAKQLLATGDAELIEGNWWGDTYWGVCKGQGENNLGKLLMLNRTALQEYI